MSFISELPFKGMSFEFHGEQHGSPICAYLVQAQPGQGPPLHTHPYVETIFMIEGQALLTIGDETREVGAGAVAVVPANTAHKFKNTGDTILRQVDVHDSPRFIQTNLDGVVAHYHGSGF